MSETVKAASPGTAAQLLSTLTPSAAAAAAASSASGSSTGSTILLQTPPPALSALSAGQIIRAVAVGRTADGKTLLDTRFGQLAIDLPVTATNGQVLRLQIARSGLPLQLNLLSLADGDENSAPPAALPHGNTASSAIVLRAPPPALSTLDAGQIIRAVAVGPTADGKTLVDTRYGQLALDLPITPMRGQALRLQIVRAGIPLQFTLLPPTDGEEDVSRATEFIRLKPGVVLRGRFEPHPVTARGQLNGDPGSRTDPATPSARFGTRNDPGSRSDPATPAARGETKSDLHSRFNPVVPSIKAGIKGAPLGRSDATMTATLAASVNRPVTGSSLPLAGNPVPVRLNLRVLSVIMPGKAALQSLPDDLVLSGTVTGTARGGGTIVQTATGNLLLPSVTQAPKGAQITLQILATPGTVLPINSAGAQAQSITALAHGWQTLQDSIDVVRAAEPGRAAAMISGTVPTTGPQLASGLAFFLNAIFGAKIQDWLGRDIARTLETQRRGDLLARITDDFSELSRLAGEPVSNDWRAVMLPLMHDDVLHQIRMYLRAHDGKDGDGHRNGEEDAGTRFVVEVELSRFGALQLDGLVRPSRFDLMVRTHRDLPPRVRTEIGELFAAANAEMKATGQIAFQVSRDFSVAPLETVAGHSVGLFA